MKNLPSSVTERSKWYLLGIIGHLSDIGNGFYGLENLKPWYKMLMWEWAMFDCYLKSEDPTKGIPGFAGKQNFFQLKMVYPVIQIMSEWLPGFGYDPIANSVMYGLDKKDLDETEIDPLFKKIEENFAALKKEECPTTISYFEEMDYHQKMKNQKKKLRTRG